VGSFSILSPAFGALGTAQDRLIAAQHAACRVHTGPYDGIGHQVDVGVDGLERKHCGGRSWFLCFGLSVLVGFVLRWSLCGFVILEGLTGLYLSCGDGEFVGCVGLGIGRATNMDLYVSWVSRCPVSRWRRTEKRQWSASYMLNIGVSKVYQETSSACARIASCHVDHMAKFGQHFQERELGC